MTGFASTIRITARSRPEVVYGDVTKKVIVTTAGRVRFNEIWPRELGYINRNVGKKQMGDIIWRCYQTVGKERTVQTLDA